MSSAIDRAFAALESGDFQAAKSLVKRILISKPANVQALYTSALIEQTANNADEALKLFNQVLKIDTRHVGAHYGKALLLSSQGRHEEALQNHDWVVRLEPRNIWGLLNRGNSLAALRKFDEAIRDYDAIIAINPRLPQSYANKSNALRELRQYEQALACSNRAIELNPNFADVWSNRGLVLLALNRFEDALASCMRALDLAPNHADAWSNKGIVLNNLKRYEEALSSCERAVALDPNCADFWSSQSLVLNSLKRHDEALSSCERALALAPNHADAWSNRGLILLSLQRFEEAVASCEQAILFKPAHAIAWAYRGVVLNNLKEYEEALKSFEQAIAIRPKYAYALFNRGYAFDFLKRHTEALDSFVDALSIEPDIGYGYGAWLYTKTVICNWDEIDSAFHHVREMVRERKSAIQPLALLSISPSANEQRIGAEVFCQDSYASHSLLHKIPKYARREKIRVGYFSADFREHPVSFLTAELFELHDKSKFELVAFSLGSREDSPTRDRIKSAFDTFMDVSATSSMDILKMARDLEIDIAVDLGGHTQDNRTEIFAFGAAPVQINYLGYPGTSGAPFMDYIIGDTTLIPEETKQHYTEKIVYLPCFQVNDRQRKISEKIFSRQEVGLPESGFVYCCFSNNYKFNPEIFSSWMKILGRVPGSVLFLLAGNKEVENNLKKEAVERNISPDRLVFGERLPVPEYLARYRVADLFLDTFPFNAGTTASDALWAGLPVLTYAGEAFASRMAASLLTNIDMPELITQSLQDYENIAVELAEKTEKLTEFKQRLARNRSATPLFDTPLFTKKLERAYEMIYERHHAGLEPDHIYVP